MTTWYIQKNMTVNYNRSAYGMSGRLKGRLIHVVNDVHSWTISSGFCQPICGRSTHRTVSLFDSNTQWPQRSHGTVPNSTSPSISGLVLT